MLRTIHSLYHNTGAFSNPKDCQGFCEMHAHLIENIPRVLKDLGLSLLYRPVLGSDRVVLDLLSRGRAPWVLYVLQAKLLAQTVALLEKSL